MIQVGEKAPDFKLEDQSGNEVSLKDFAGKKVLLSWHPLAFTSICALQMNSLEDNAKRFQEANTVVLGMSVDAQPSKEAWAESLGLQEVQILADFHPHGEVSKAYGLFNDEMGASVRANVLVDEEGTVIWAKEYPLKETPDVEEVFEALKNA